MQISGRNEASGIRVWRYPLLGSARLSAELVGTRRVVPMDMKLADISGQTLLQIGVPARAGKRSKTSKTSKATRIVKARRSIAQMIATGAVDRGVEVSGDLMKVLAAGAVVAIAVSGGKDSIAAALATIEFLNGIGHTGPRVLIHADLGDPDPAMDVEWTD